MKPKDALPISASALLAELCGRVQQAHARAEEERKRETFGDSHVIELLLTRIDKVRVELRKEQVGHHEPHIHITHSDKIDVSVGLRDFRILAGRIDRKTYKHLVAELRPKQQGLLDIWNELNEKDNSVAAERMVSNLFPE
jgi:hypothetical protein